MSDNSKIEWTDASWNPVTGCTKVSAGCDNCYAETFAERWRGTPGHHFEQGFDVKLWPGRLGIPLHWRKSRRIFVNSMSDVFHEAVPDDFIARMFAVMASSQRHIFQVLTKRHARMRSLLSSQGFRNAVQAATAELLTAGLPDFRVLDEWPLPNVWLGVSVENQKWADIRIPALCETPAAVRFLSCEPMLGPVSIPFEIQAACSACGGIGYMPCDAQCGKAEGPAFERIHWIIVGGESGHGARHMDLTWARALVQQGADWDVPVFVKQLGSVLGRKIGAGPKGSDLEKWPQDLQVRQFPLATEDVAA